MNCPEVVFQAPHATAQKRKQSNNANTGRATKHRSSQACNACRLRKVRCDVLRNGTSCTNCRLDNTECVVLASRRGKNRSRPHASHSPMSHGSTSGQTSIVREEVDNASYEATATPVGPSDAADVPVCVTFDDENPQVGENDPSTNGIIPTHQTPNPSTREGLPPFIASIPAYVPAEDVDFLIQKGALTMPNHDLRTEILRSYQFSIHPFMPILDLQTFIPAVLDQREDGYISLFLFQAVMFAGLASLDLDIVHSLGFESTKQAREVFFDRAKLLYEFDIEPEETAVLQSLMLMSWWYGRWNQRRHTWHWTGLALSVAQNMGLHREPTVSCGSEKIRGFRRRLWWSLYIRDRLLALGTRRPMRIQDDSFDVAMLRLDDFGVRELNNGQHLGQDVDENNRIVVLCIELAKLCVCIGHVLKSQYTTLSNFAEVRHTMMVVPRRHGDDTVSALEQCDNEINDWCQSSADNIHKSWSSSIAQGTSNMCSEIQWTMLNMLHLTLVNVLHRTQALQSSPAAEVQGLRRTSRLKVKDSARNVTKLAHTMLRRDQVRYMGVPGVTILVAASLSHMLDIRSGDEDVRDASILRFYQSIQVLQALRTIYASADSAVSFLASVIRKAGISVPPQVASPAPDFTSVASEGPVGGVANGAPNKHYLGP
ncbi:hypothetical protein K504DRAFT_427462 [Pleomassaria siparia CBS 279.74]|uniref:Zn(2)-C6 fungal-type domain-containing protein n=1 Tax=Pleomassaria siparia CBS 279.74 TaxID=1314801 RepID=A0A6G1KEK0_9PLEO|nr:hypothetical protein K504DRAFT_427462 [Pleomassaria siparia CBS 279.74]